MEKNRSKYFDVGRCLFQYLSERIRLKNLLIAWLFPQIWQFCHYCHSLVRSSEHWSIWSCDSKFRSLFIVSNEMFGLQKAEFKLIVSKVLNIKLFLYVLRVIDHVAFVIISICKIEGLNIEFKAYWTKKAICSIDFIALKTQKNSFHIFLYWLTKEESNIKKSITASISFLQEYM